MNQAQLQIIGYGAVTALGLDAKTSFAAARAGLSRAAPSTQFLVYDPDSGEGQGVVVHEVPIVTYGFEGAARLIQLMNAALEDLTASLDPNFGSGGAVPVYLALPSAVRPFTGSELLADDEMKNAWQDSLKELPDLDHDTVASFLNSALEGTGLENKLILKAFDLSGHAAGGKLLNLINDDLAAGHHSTAILAGVDSYLGNYSINWLSETQRLKTDESPEALQPGEAACFVVMGKGQQGTTIKHIVTADEALSLLSGELSFGKVLAHAIYPCMKSHISGTQTVPWIICDHNGEFYRANEWGHTLNHLKAHLPDITEFATWFPAGSFGDIGSAFVPLAIAQAHTALQRGYGVGQSVTVCAASDNGLRTAAQVSFA